MLRNLLTLSLLALGLISALSAEEKPADARLYELRTYHAGPDKLDALLKRFREHTLMLFERHGMTNIAYWVPIPNPDNLLVYLLAYPDKDARDKSWAAFGSDPEWQKAARESEVDGKLVSKADQQFMKPTDFSMGFDTPSTDGRERLFEMRTYTATPGNLANLHARFRDHTRALFNRHGITNLGYFQFTPDQKGADNTLLYFLAHKDAAAAEKSWTDFRNDPEWVAAKNASEQKGGGPLTTEGGVVSVFLKPVDFSPLK